MSHQHAHNIILYAASVTPKAQEIQGTDTKTDKDTDTDADTDTHMDTAFRAAAV